ncbi:MAG: prolyl oligopeptidase family serine peptidase [Telluria sp.]
MHYALPARLLSFALACTALPVLAAPPASTFFQNCALGRTALSPDGTMVLANVHAPGERESLVVVDLATMKPTVLARYSDADVRGGHWLSGNRVSYSLWKTDVRLVNTVSSVMVVNPDGTDLRNLSRTIVDQLPFASHCGAGSSEQVSGVVDPFFGNAKDLFIFSVYDGFRVAARLNTENGATSGLIAPPRAISWLLDNGGALRAVVTREGTQEALHFRDDNGAWRKLATFAQNSSAALRPVLYAGKTLFVHARNGADKFSVYRYNLERGEVEGEPLVTSPEYDLKGWFVTDASKALGYRYLSDTYETVWFDKGMQALQKEVDALFPDTVNSISTGASGKAPYVMVRSRSDIQPGIVRIYHRDTKTVASLGRVLPDIVPAQMASMEMKRYPARDGLSIPAFLTLPKIAVQKNLPLILLVKPDPWSRWTVWGWDPAVQFLASRGYAVLEPESRGSRGFGAAFQAAGVKQWGRTMQDDLADGAKWAVAQGIADPKRICIAGSGYGGYAAMMGLIKDSDLFRCGISMGGIVDLPKTVTRVGQDLGTASELQALIGHPTHDAAQLLATSPLHNAARLTRPVLLAYGQADPEVPAGDGQAMYDALKAGNPGAELHMFDTKGQAWAREQNAAQLWMRIEAFLEKHIGKR